jgi:DNA repair photolyase
MSEKKTVSGTKEWAATNANVMTGCSHGCLYCYASASAFRFERVEPGKWGDERVNKRALEKGYGKRKGTIMFPTAHDITPDNLSHCKTVLSKMLEAGNDVLIVSKPHLVCIRDLCEALKEFKDQILFRFTIGSVMRSILAFWEPNAPEPAERITCLKHAFENGFATSVSMEPLLDVKEDDIAKAVRAMEGLVTDAIWLGKANKLMDRLGRNKQLTEEVEKRAQELIESQSDERIVSLYERFKDHPKIKWKESIKEVVGIEVPTEAGLDI